MTHPAADPLLPEADPPQDGELPLPPLGGVPADRGQWLLEEDPEESVLDYLKALPRRWLDGEIKAALRSNTTSAPEEPQTAQSTRWEVWLFLLGLAIYLVTRLVALDKFPIYFFSDEALQTLHAQSLLNNGFRDQSRRFLPLFFSNAGQYNLSLSVYLQLLAAPFERSVYLTRAIPALVTSVAPLLSGLAMRKFFKLRSWWLMPFLFSAVPSWFLHSRTAFETSLGAALFAAALYAYLYYRLKEPKALPWAVVAAGLCFYSYAALQPVVVVCFLLLLFLDWPYHWQQRRHLLPGMAVLLLLAIPYLVFRARNPQALSFQLNLLGSYWLEAKPLSAKLLDLLTRWLSGLNPVYWFFPGSQDLARHTMRPYAHMPVYFLPFTFWGLWLAIKNLRQPGQRALLAGLLAAPVGAALVQPAITRLLVVVVPLVWLSALGLEGLISKINNAQSQKGAALTYMAILSIASLIMLDDALINGPAWYQDYGLYGMQWGAPKIFREAQAWQEAFPEDEVVLSPSWANGTDILARYSLPNGRFLRLDSYQYWTLNQEPLDEGTVLIVTPQEYAAVMEEPKFLPPEVLKTIPYPNGQPGFYFLRLAYSSRADGLFAAEREERQRPLQASLQILGQPVELTYPRLDIGEIELIFDGDPNSLVRGLEANPFELNLNFSEPANLQGLELRLGAPAMQITAKLSLDGGTEKAYSLSVPEADLLRTATLSFDGSQPVRQLTLSLEQMDGQVPAHIHIWELKLIP